MKNIFKTLTNVRFQTDRRSHDVILAARRTAWEARVDAQSGKWGVHIGETPYRTLI
ncbi:hypothetical protein [Stackebrandtia nassauensis]|uniref:Uncharacterized protein n=1 Tax=Stackebrandtia nassauensis (strain DSM 44728 / CIP 108903 / NRRL B-16338 / NBRC 102104 / LLR-40K-21) TaxID=446470 RepID=D3Q9F0_STANL|nr:hypothetical protein [Stackebrandtia nassauensis]ADD42632.1 hypothetical protein Snas_2957 [Stackebrandtia nassauensis DSM 44728]